MLYSHAFWVSILCMSKAHTPRTLTNYKSIHLSWVCLCMRICFSCFCCNHCIYSFKIKSFALLSRQKCRVCQRKKKKKNNLTTCMDAIPPHYNLINKKQKSKNKSCAPCMSRSLISAWYESLISRADRNADIVAGSHFTIQSYSILIGSDDRH